MLRYTYIACLVKPLLPEVNLFEIANRTRAATYGNEYDLTDLNTNACLLFSYAIR
jgi:hypothetical protein